MAGALVESADRWLVPMAGTVTQCRLDYAFSMVIADCPAGTFEVRIEHPFVVVGHGGEVELDPEGEPQQMAPALRVLRRAVEQAIAFKDGSLEVTFDDGSVLRVAVDEDYEAWNIVGPNGLRIVSMPGGELAIWGREDT